MEAHITRLYAVFCDARLPTEALAGVERVLALGGEPDFTQRIDRAPREQIAASDIFPALRWLELCGPAGPEGFRYLLPRACAAMARDEVDVFWEGADIAGGLERFGWRSWPAAKQAAVWDFLEAWVVETYAQGAPWHGLRQALSMGEVLAPDRDWLAPLLRGDVGGRMLRWLAEPERWVSLAHDDALLRCLRRHGAVQVLEEAFEAAEDEDSVELLAAALELLWSTVL